MFVLSARIKSNAVAVETEVPCDWASNNEPQDAAISLTYKQYCASIPECLLYISMHLLDIENLVL